MVSRPDSADYIPPAVCYRCGEARVYLAADLTPAGIAHYADIGIVMAKCLGCGLDQHHPGRNVPALPAEGG